MTKNNGKSTNAWLWTMISGLIALVLGLYLLLGANSSAPLIVGYALSGYLTISGAIQTLSSLFNRNAPGSSTDKLRGLVGFVGGGVLLLLTYFDILSPSAGHIVLGVLLIVYGALGVFEVLLDRGSKPFSWMPLIINIQLVALGVLAFVFRAREMNLLTWAGALLSIIGLILVIYGYFIQKRGRSTAVGV